MPDDGDGESPGDRADPWDELAELDPFGTPDRAAPFEALDAAFAEASDRGDPPPDDAAASGIVEPPAETADPHRAPDDPPGIDVVPKRAYCETCRYFSAPPGVACTHEGTDILAFVDRRHVRVKHCPIVARRRGADPDD